MLRERDAVGWAGLLEQYSGTSTPENFGFLLPSVCDSQDFPGGLCFTSKKMGIEQGRLYMRHFYGLGLRGTLHFIG